MLTLYQAPHPLILKALSPEETDEIWNYWIITSLMTLFSDENRMPILPSIKGIAEGPTQDERIEEVDEAAMLFLRNDFERAFAHRIFA